MNDAGEDAAGVQQISYGAKRCERGRFRGCGGIQVGPRSWDERTRTVGEDQNQVELAVPPHVGEDQNQVELAVPPHPAQQRKRLALKRVTGSHDGDRGRIALEVGSVLPLRSTRSITNGLESLYDIGSMTEDSSGS